MTPQEAQPRVFISYARSDGEAFARDLRARLEAEGVPLWRDREGMEGGRDWWQQITAAIDRVEYLVLAVTPAALASPLVRREWRYARQRGVAVYPVQAGPIDFPALPRWMRSVHFYDLAHEWRKFVNDLHVRPQAVRVPFMVEDLPPDFVPRPREYAALRDQLLDGQHEEPIAITTALRGAGGYGKTALARALCHDEAIQNAFDDGILWVTLGEKPGDLTGRVEDLIYMLSGQRPGFASLDTAVAAFAELLADRDLLIVVDDAWDELHVRPFLQGGERCARIITTRNVDVLPASARRVHVDAMATEEAAALLSHGLAAHPGFGPLAARLGEWPLLLKLVNGALRERVLHQGQPLDEALGYVAKALDKRGLTVFDGRDAAARRTAVSHTLALSMAQLSEDERQRFGELAVFPEDAEVPLATIAALWAHTGGLDEWDSEALCERLARLSLLLALDLARRSVRLHDVVRLFLLQCLDDQGVSLHRQLLESGRPSGGWATLPATEPYWWQHLFFHLRGADLADEMHTTALDLRYVSEKTWARTAFSVDADLEQAAALFPADRTLAELRRLFLQTAHLFGDCRSAAEVRATLFARFEAKSALDRAAGAIQEPRLVPLAPLPDRPHPALVRTLGNRRAAVRACAISADGRFVATASGDQEVTLWDPERGAPRRHFAADAQSRVAGRAVRALDLSADGSRLAAATGDRRLWVWDTATGAVLAVLQGHTDEVTDCALSADGRWLLSSSLDESLRLWDLADGQLCRMMARNWAHNEQGWLVPVSEHGHWAAVRGCAISADGALAASASSDQTVIVWDLATGRARRVLQGHGSGVNCCAFSPDGRTVASGGSDGTLRLWPLEGGEPRAVAAHPQGITACAFAADGRHLVTASADGTLRVWSGTGDELIRTLVGHGDWVHDCGVSAAAGLVVSAGNDGTVRLWQLAGRGEPYQARGHEGPALACAATAGGRHVFTGGQDGQLALWDMRRALSLQLWRAHEGSVRACALRPDGQLLASASADRQVALWDVTRFERTATLAGHRDQVNGCAFHPAGRLLATVSNDRTVRLWDLETRSRRLAWVAHEQWINACAFSPDGRWLVTAAADGTLVRWAMDFDDSLYERWLTDPQPLAAEAAAQALSRTPLVGHEASVNHCCFVAAGGPLVSAASDATVRLWDIEAARPVRTLTGHLDAVNGVAADATGSRLASVSSDGGLRVWQLEDGRCSMALHVDGELSACSWAGSRLLACGARGVYLLEGRDTAAPAQA